jgi:hypothetical protein
VTGDRRPWREDPPSEPPPWPPDDEEMPRSARAWATVEALLAGGPVSWSSAVAEAARTGPLSLSGGSQLLARACRYGACHWRGTWETSGRVLYPGPGEARPVGTARRAPRQPRPRREWTWTRKDIEAIKEALLLAERHFRALAIDQRLADRAAWLLTPETPAVTADNGTGAPAESEQAPAQHRDSASAGPDQREQPRDAWGAAWT